MATDNEIMYAIMNGINFGGAKKSDDKKGGVKTKARKKAYHTGSHNSGSAKHKAEIRKRVKQRSTQKKG
ncbi:MAG: hypothetical protein IJY78_05750 [Bacteroidaceae bacterium]|nr:hypothetical protein [Bacteroidaceae bacterium]